MMKKKAGKKTGKKNGKRKAAAKQPLDAGKVRDEIVGLVREEAKAITVGVVDKAKHGSLPQAKYLFEVAKIFPKIEDGEPPAEEDESLAKMLADLKPPRKSDDDEGDEEGSEHDAEKAEADGVNKAESAAVGV